MEYYIQTKFRILSDEDIGHMQVLMNDRKVRVQVVADRYKCSVATAYKVRKAIPAHLMTCVKTKKRA